MIPSTTKLPVLIFSTPESCRLGDWSQKLRVDWFDREYPIPATFILLPVRFRSRVVSVKVVISIPLNAEVAWLLDKISVLFTLELTTTPKIISIHDGTRVLSILLL